MRRGMTSVSSTTHHRTRVGGGSLWPRFRGNAADRYLQPVTDPPNAVASACPGQTPSSTASSDADTESGNDPSFSANRHSRITLTGTIPRFPPLRVITRLPAGSSNSAAACDWQASDSP